MTTRMKPADDTDARALAYKRFLVSGSSPTERAFQAWVERNRNSLEPIFSSTTGSYPIHFVEIPQAERKTMSKTAPKPAKAWANRSLSHIFTRESEREMRKPIGVRHVHRVHVAPCATHAVVSKAKVAEAVAKFPSMSVQAHFAVRSAFIDLGLLPPAKKPAIRKPKGKR